MLIIVFCGIFIDGFWSFILINEDWMDVISSNILIGFFFLELFEIYEMGVCRILVSVILYNLKMRVVFFLLIEC